MGSDPPPISQPSGSSGLPFRPEELKRNRVNKPRLGGGRIDLRNRKNQFSKPGEGSVSSSLLLLLKTMLNSELFSSSTDTKP